MDLSPALCDPVCLNGGTCIRPNTCHLPAGFYAGLGVKTRNSHFFLNHSPDASPCFFRAYKGRYQFLKSPCAAHHARTVRHCIRNNICMCGGIFWGAAVRKVCVCEPVCMNGGRCVGQMCVTRIRLERERDVINVDFSSRSVPPAVCLQKCLNGVNVWAEQLAIAVPAGRELSAKSQSVNRGVYMEADVFVPMCALAEVVTWELFALRSFLSREDKEMTRGVIAALRTLDPYFTTY
ncbi:hypothetical protein cypCar_00016609 [Cyprinus carpio]|nr:hypothetical protein cypCar_00016609 [Cyprinus carpio]